MAKEEGVPAGGGAREAEGRALVDYILVRDKNSNSKLNQSTRVVKIDLYITIRAFERTHGPKVDSKKIEVWVSGATRTRRGARDGGTCTCR